MIKLMSIPQNVILKDLTTITIFRTIEPIPGYSYLIGQVSSIPCFVYNIAIIQILKDTRTY